jgi:F-type H+-transporting ATPase subunit b
MKKVGILSIALAFASSPLPLWAEEKKGGSLPQLDPSFYPGELFWFFVCFFVFFLMMQLWAVPKFQRTQGSRQQILDKDLSAARKASEQAKTLMAEGDKALATARADVRKNVDAIVAAANEKAAKQREAQEAQIAVRLKEANAKIEVARKAALQDVPKMVDEMVLSIVAKVLPTVKAK